MSNKTTTETGLKPQTKQVQIIRKEANSSHVPAEIRQTAIHRLSSVFVNNVPLKEIEKELEKKLLPLQIDVPANASEFRKESRDFWRSITVKVPSEGAILNLNVDEDGYPESVKDYLTYIWAQHHPHVAKSKSEMERSAKKRFYIHDPDRETKEENDRVKSKAKAYREFSKVLDDKKAIDRVLRVMGTGNPDKMTQAQKENALHDVMDSNPKKFYETATDNSLEIKDLIADLVENEVVRKSGNSYFYIDQLLGENLDEAVGFFGNSKHSKEVNDMKAKLEDRKSVVA